MTEFQTWLRETEVLITGDVEVGERDWQEMFDDNLSPDEAVETMIANYDDDGILSLDVDDELVTDVLQQNGFETEAFSLVY